MIRGVILEGLSTAGKTSVFSAIKKLLSQKRNVEKTIIAISEHYSQVLHSYQGVLRSMDKDEHIQLLIIMLIILSSNTIGLIRLVIRNQQTVYFIFLRGSILIIERHLKILKQLKYSKNVYQSLMHIVYY